MRPDNGRVKSLQKRDGSASGQRRQQGGLNSMDVMQWEGVEDAVVGGDSKRRRNASNGRCDGAVRQDDAFRSACCAACGHNK